ncbi:MAG: hypothetical protein AAFV29_15400, partial [Myxococcota bacterium]
QPGRLGHVFVGCYSGRVVEVAPDGEVLRRFRAHEGAVKAVRLHPQQPMGLSCSADGEVKAWSFDGETIRTFPGHMAIVNDIDLDAGGQRLATVGRDFCLRIFDVASGEILWTERLGFRSLKSVCFATIDTVVVGDYWGSVFVVNLSASVVHRYKIATNGISSLALGANGHVVAASYDGSVSIIDPQTGGVLQRVEAMQQRRVIAAPQTPAPPHAPQTLGFTA